MATLQREDEDARDTVTSSAAASDGQDMGPKRLHVSNIPFRFRESDLRNLLAVCSTLLYHAAAVAVGLPPRYPLTNQWIAGAVMEVTSK